MRARRDQVTHEYGRLAFRLDHNTLMPARVASGAFNRQPGSISKSPSTRSRTFAASSGAKFSSM